MWVVIFEKDCGVQNSQLLWQLTTVGAALSVVDVRVTLSGRARRESYVRVCNLLLLSL